MRGKCPKDKGGPYQLNPNASPNESLPTIPVLLPPSHPAISFKSRHHIMIPLISQHADELAELCRRHHVKRLEVFGSAAVGDFNPKHSDIDFLVDYHPFPGPGKADAYFGLLEDLQQLFERPVDLVVDRAIENPYFRKSLDETKIPVYEA